MIQRVFEREDLIDLVDGVSQNLTLIECNISGRSRWQIYYDIVFRDEDTGKFYSATYAEGATEYQETELFGTTSECTCVEVVPVQKLVTVYEAV